MTRPIITLLSALHILGILTARAAVAPYSSADLKTKASLIVSATVIEVTSRKQRSKVEKALGIHVDRVFTIKLKVKKISKGSEIKAGDEILVEAWQPVLRIPPLPGLQGHETIPRKGDKVTLYLKEKTGKSYEPLLPNGIVIKKDDQ